MKPEHPSWPELSQQAEGQLSADFSRRVIARAGQVRAARRQLTVMSATLGLCLLGTSLTMTWMTSQQHEQNLTQWQSLSTVTLAIDRGL